MNHTLKEYFKNPFIIINWIAAKGLLNWLDDESYLKLRFRASIGKKLDLENPQTFNEKLQWLKLHDRRPEYTMMVDKVKAKDYVASIIGKKYIIPTLGVWENPEDIDLNGLPNQFVLKCNHNSGKGMYICRNKSEITEKKWKEIKEELRKGLKENYYLFGREWPYLDVPRRILAEKFMVDESGTELKDYKFYCFGGKANFMFIASGRASEDKTFTYYDMKFNRLPFEWGAPINANHIERPEGFNHMKELAEKLAIGLPHARIDFYDVNGSIYFGEITFFDGTGMTPFIPDTWDEHYGKLITLPTNNVPHNFLTKKLK